MGAYNEPRISGRSVKVAAIVLIALGIAGVAAYESVKIVDAGHRGVLLHWSAIDLTHPPLDEGLHFVVPFQDDVVNIEVRTPEEKSGAFHDVVCGGVFSFGYVPPCTPRELFRLVSFSK